MLRYIEPFNESIPGIGDYLLKTTKLFLSKYLLNKFIDEPVIHYSLHCNNFIQKSGTINKPVKQ